MNPKKNEVMNQAKIAESALANQADLIYNVSMMQKVASSKINFQFDNVNLLECIKASAEMLSKQAQKKKIKIEHSIDDLLYVNGDMNMLVNCVFNNVLSNAIKFSFEKSQVLISATQEGENIIVTVRDSGVGMSEQKAAAVFQVDGHTSSQGTAGEFGSGFGLPIAKTVTEKLGGSISLFSKEQAKYPNDCGTTVTINLIQPLFSKKMRLPSKK